MSELFRSYGAWSHSEFSSTKMSRLRRFFGKLNLVKMKLEATPQTAAARLKKISPLRPTLAIVLGSGFHHVLTELRVEKKISYAKIPGFPGSERERPRGRIVFRPSGQNAGDGFERAGAFLRRPSDGTGHVCRPRAGGVWHPRFAADERGGRHQQKISSRAISWC